jgi:uncharacterized protein (DUF1501 family)
MIDRRLFLSAATASAAVSVLGVPALAAGRASTEKRFVFIIQRGAADGLSAIAPVGDPAFTAQRGALAEDAATGAKLDATFALHPSLAETAKLYSAGEALFVHAVASPYRDRSHFDGQNVLETGGTAAYRLKDGWMNRLLGLLPPAEGKALAVSSTVPMALRGTHEVSSYAPSRLPNASDDLLTRVGAMYDADPQLHPLWQSAMETRAAAGDVTGQDGQNGAALGALAAKLLKDDARVAMIETIGWDTHANQRGRLNAQLRGLDQTLASLKSGLGPDWANTVVLVATEFGRTARINGTGGTDHGTGSAAMLIGGAVAGGRVIGDWPGLADSALYEGRDLKPTTALDSLIAGAVAQHHELDPARTMKTLFPESQGSALQAKLVKA